MKARKRKKKEKRKKKRLKNKFLREKVIFKINSFIILYKTALILLTIFLSLSSLRVLPFYNFSPVLAQAAAQSQGSSDNNAQRKILEEELARYEEQIKQHEDVVASLKKQGKTLSSEIKSLNTQIDKLNLQIKTTTLNLKQLDNEIFDTQTKISATESSIEFNKEAISRLIREYYENERQGLLAVVLTHPKISDFFGDLNNLIFVQDNLKETLKKIILLKQNLVDSKEALAQEREDTESLKKYQDAQKSSVAKTQDSKKDLLNKTKGKETEYQKLLAETKKTAAEIRKQIFQFLGGGELSFEKAYELAKYAESATGVRAAMLLAVLDRESALGKNVGRCDYKTATHPTRDIPTFLRIIQDLGLTNDLESGLLKVSCANGDGAYGGAMGPAQFIPSTWIMYKDKIEAITGSKPANPWKNSDAFVATALYLKDAGAANASLSQERIAAAKYYAGTRWKKFLWTYGERVVSLAQKFQDDIDLLENNLSYAH